MRRAAVMMWTRRILALFCVALCAQPALTQVSKIRWCTISGPEETKCAEMRVAYENQNLKMLECVAGENVQDCMGKISSNIADLITLDGGDIYQAGLKFNMIPIMQEEYAEGMKGYHAIAAVKKSNVGITLDNLRGKKSCHTGVRKTAGWNVPVGFLLETGRMETARCQDDIHAVASFFNQSCAPGALSPAYNPEGDNPANLCGLCQNMDASEPCPRNSHEPYYNYAGAFRCLAEDAGDVAFIKPVTIMDNTDGNNDDPWATGLRSQDFEILCPDGTRAAVGDYQTCNLAFVPSHAVMASKNYDTSVLADFRSVLNQAQELFGMDGNTNGFSMFASGSGSKDLLFKDSTIRLDNVVDQEYTQFLGEEYLQTLKGLDKCPVGSFRWCVTSMAERKKCEAMSSAFMGASLSPAISCYTTQPADDACARDIASDVADLVTMDAGKLYQYGKRHGVMPIMAEDYGQGDVTYWGVAVVKRSSSFTIDELKGKKSCHTGYFRTVGWKVPIGFLIDRGDIVVDNECDVPKAVGEFFSMSCVTGVLEPANNPHGTNPDNLCELCVGEGANKCKPNVDPYSGYNGAFRCLAEDAGDVAFVKHVTVGENTDGMGSDTWNSGLRKADYQLLCPDGSRADVDNYETCNLARVPSHVVTTAGDKTAAEKQEMVDLLSSGQDMFKLDDGGTFKMFDSSEPSYGQHQSNLLFKDSTQQLLPVDDGDTFETYLSNEYLAEIKALECDLATGAAGLPASPSSSLVLLLLSALDVVRVVLG